MRKLDVLANEKFGGDIEQTLNYLLFNRNGDKIDDYVDEMTPEEARAVLMILRGKVVKGYGGEENFKMAVNIDEKLEELKLTKEEVLNAEKNPYKAKLGKSFFKMIIAQGGIVSLMVAANNFGIDISSLGLISSVVTGLLSFDMVQKIEKYVKYNKLKKELLSEPKFDSSIAFSEDNSLRRR